MSSNDPEFLIENGNMNNNNVSSNQLHLIISVMSFLLALIACILAIVAVSGKETAQVNVNVPSAVSDTRSGSSNDEKIWLLHIGDTDTNIEYINEQTGRVEGFNVDIINAVCRIANKNCRLVFDVYSNCWQNVAGDTARGGVGLMAGWFDACAAWPITKDRLRTFRSSEPFSQDLTEVFVTLKGNPGSFWNPRNLSGKHIGFIDASAASEHCLAKLDGSVPGAILPENQIHHYTNTDQIIAALSSNEIDAAFVIVPRSRRDEFEVVSDELKLCDRGGFAMMTRYDNTLADWWNPAQQRLLATSEYKTICEDVRQTHGHKSGQDPKDFCIGL